MALILDETFSTAIPGGFATARSSGGTFTQTYNAGAQGVDLSQTIGAYGMWDLTSVALSVAGEVEADIQILSTVTGSHALGLWLVDGSSPSVSNGVLGGYTNGSGVIYAGGWSGSTAWAGNSPSVVSKASKPFETMGARHTLNMRWDMGSPTEKARVELRVDGDLILVAPPPTDFVSLRPAVFVYHGALRLHGIKVWDAPQSGLTEYGCKILQRAVALGAFSTLQERLPSGPITQIRRGALGFRNIYQGGNGRIVGTVKESTPPANTPLRRKVQLIDESTRLLVRETWSDALTGAYDFQSVDAFSKYTVITYDYAQNYRAVIADNLTLANGGVELMP